MACQNLGLQFKIIHLKKWAMSRNRLLSFIMCTILMLLLTMGEGLLYLWSDWIGAETWIKPEIDFAPKGAPTILSSHSVSPGLLSSRCCLWQNCSLMNLMGKATTRNGNITPDYFRLRTLQISAFEMLTSSQFGKLDFRQFRPPWWAVVTVVLLRRKTAGCDRHGVRVVCFVWPEFLL